MRHRDTRTFAFAVAMGIAGTAWGQAQDAAEAVPSAPGTVLSDVQPLPAEDRSSAGGAIRLHDRPVRAQQGGPVAAGERTGILSVGRNALKVLTRSRTQTDVADARQQRQEALTRDGAGSLDSP